MVPSLDGKPVRILDGLLFEPIGNRLLDLFLLEFDKDTRRMKTLRPNRLLFRRKAGEMSPEITHVSLLCSLFRFGQK